MEGRDVMMTLEQALADPKIHTVWYWYGYRNGRSTTFLKEYITSEFLAEHDYVGTDGILIYFAKKTDIE
jgi:hypothetical protein